MPLPPQLRLGVSCICTVSDGPPEALGRSAFTVIGSYDRISPSLSNTWNQQWMFCIASIFTRGRCRPADLGGDNSPLRSAIQPQPLD